MHIKIIKFEDRLILYWGYKDYVFNKEYSFYVNGDKHGITNKNSFTINNLKPNTSYIIEIKDNNETIYSKNIKTLKEREKIIVPIALSNNKICTSKLQKILNKASGKIVVFTKGTYLSGALFVKPNTHIYLEEGALLQGSELPSSYLPLIPSRFEGLTMKCYASLINIGKCNPNKGYEKGNIYIYGQGEIRGGGHNLCEAMISEQINNVDASKYDPKLTNARTLAGRYRGRLIQINNSSNIVIEGLTLGYSSAWNIHPIYSKNIVICNALIQSKNLPNGDGIDPDSSENIDIFNIHFDTGDDCVAVKSGRNPDGNIVNRPSKNIEVFNCDSKTGHGCCIGSEISGGISHIRFFNCNFGETRYGVQIKTTKKRGGYVKDVIVEDVTLAAINCRTVSYNDEGLSSGQITIFKNFKFKNVYLVGYDIGNYGGEHNKCNHIEITGFEDSPKSFSNITLENISYNEEKRVLIKNATNVKER